MNGEEQGVEHCKEIRNCSIVNSPTKRQDEQQCGWEIRGKSYGRNQAVLVELSYTFILPQISLSSQLDQLTVKERKYFPYCLVFQHCLTREEHNCIRSILLCVLSSILTATGLSSKLAFHAGLRAVMLISLGRLNF